MTQRHPRHLLEAATILALVVLIGACVPVFTDGVFQTLNLTFKIGRAIEAGQKTDFQTLVFPEKVKVAKRWLRISGRISPSGGAPLPDQIKVEASLENLATGRSTQKILVNLQVASDGTFAGSKKIKKNIGEGEMMGVTLQPTGNGIPANSQITVCVDLVKKRGDLDSLPVCVTGGDSPGGSTATLSSIQSSIFTPSCALSGCHNAASASAGLVLASGQSFGNLVNVPSSQVDGLDRVEPGDPERSYLVKKLRGDGDISGSRMPRGSGPLSNSQINQIVQWIQAGAPND